MMRMTKLSVVGATQFSLKYLEIDAGVNLYLKISMAGIAYSRPLEACVHFLCVDVTAVPVSTFCRHITVV